MANQSSEAASGRAGGPEAQEESLKQLLAQSVQVLHVVSYEGKVSKDAPVLNATSPTNIPAHARLSRRP